VKTRSAEKGNRRAKVRKHHVKGLFFTQEGKEYGKKEAGEIFLTKMGVRWLRKSGSPENTVRQTDAARLRS